MKLVFYSAGQQSVSSRDFSGHKELTQQEKLPQKNHILLF